MINLSTSGHLETADTCGERLFGRASFASFDPRSVDHCKSAVALRAKLVSIGFDAERAAGLFRVSDTSEIRADRADYYSEFVLPSDEAGNAARFFMLHELQPEADVVAWLGLPLERFLLDMGAIVRVGGALRSLVSCSWFAGQLIFADARMYNRAWPVTYAFSDFVMPPGLDSLGLVNAAPAGHRKSMLDICCGSGAQALAFADRCEQVVGVDINPRALRFAVFNAAVNEVNNATFTLGDCYDSLAEGTYDAIVANPPFVPFPSDSGVPLFRAGGPRGDDVLSRIFRGAAERLAPGGFLAVVADLVNSDSLPIRIRQWQLQSRRTLVLLHNRYDILKYAETHVAHLPPRERQAELQKMLQHFAQQGIRTVDFGYVIQDGEKGETVVSRPVSRIGSSMAEDVVDWFAHQRRLGQGGIENVRLRLAPGLRLMREESRQEGGAVVSSSHLIPAPNSMLAPTSVSEVGYSLLRRICESEVWRRDVKEERDVQELERFLIYGLVRLCL